MTHWPAPHRTHALHSTPLHSTPLHSTPLHSTPLHSTPGKPLAHSRTRCTRHQSANAKDAAAADEQEHTQRANRLLHHGAMLSDAEQCGMMWGDAKHTLWCVTSNIAYRMHAHKCTQVHTDAPKIATPLIAH